MVMPKQASKQSSGARIFQRSLKALADKTKNPKIENPKETRDESASVTDTLSDMSKKRPNVSMRGHDHDGLRYFSGRRVRSESETGGKTPQSAEALVETVQRHSKDHSNSASGKSVTSYVKKADQSVEDWTKDLIEIDRSRETDDQNHEDEPLSEDLLPTDEHRTVEEEAEEAEYVTDVIKETNVKKGIFVIKGTEVIKTTDVIKGSDIIKNTDAMIGPDIMKQTDVFKGFCEPNSSCKSNVTGPLQSTPKKKHTRKSFQKHSFDLADTDVIYAIMTKKEETPQKTNCLEGTANENIPFSGSSVSGNSDKGDLGAKNVPDDTKKNRQDTRNGKERVRNGSWSSEGSKNSLFSPVFNCRGSAMIHNRERHGFRGGHHQSYISKLPQKGDFATPRRFQRGRHISPDYKPSLRTGSNKTPALRLEEVYVSKPSTSNSGSDEMRSDMKKYGEHDVQAWELPTSEDWTSEIDDNEEFLRIVSEGLLVQSSIVKEICDEGQLCGEEEMRPADTEVDNDFAKGEIEEVVKDKPYLPPPPPEDESFNSTEESDYKSAKDSLEHTESVEAKIESLVENSFQGQDENRCSSSSDKAQKSVKKDFYDGEHNGCEQVDLKTVEKKETGGSDTDVSRNVGRDKKVNVCHVVVEDEESQCDSQALDIVTDLSDVDYYESGIISQENIDLNLSTDCSSKRLGPSASMKQDLRKDLPLRLGDRKQSSHDISHDYRKPWNDTNIHNDNMYNEWYQSRYCEWYNSYYDYYGSCRHWDWPTAPGYPMAVNPWERPEYCDQQFSHDGQETRAPSYSRGRVSDFWQDRMPNWVDSQTERAQKQQLFSGTSQESGLQSHRTVKSEVGVQKDMHSDHQGDRVESEPAKGGPTAKTENTDKKEARAPNETGHNRSECPREKLGERGQCSCKEENVQYLLWRMCKCPLGNPPRLQKIYHGGGQEEWSLDLGYQSYDSIDDPCMSGLAKGKLFPWLPTAASTPGLPADAGSKLHFHQFLSQNLSHGGPRPPPGFQPMVYTLTSDNRPTGFVGQPGSQHAASGACKPGDEKDALGEPLDNDNRQQLATHPCKLQQNNNATSERAVQNVADINNNRLCDAGTSVTEVREHSAADDSLYLKLPKSLTSSASHLKEASVNLHEASRTNANLNSALHTFSEAIMAIGKNLTGTQDTGTQQTSPGDTREVTLRKSSDINQGDVVGVKSTGSQTHSKNYSADKKLCGNFKGSVKYGPDSSPDYLDIRNVSEMSSSVCDADNESDTSWDEGILEHPMLTPPTSILSVNKSSGRLESNLPVGGFIDREPALQPREGSGNTRNIQMTHDQKDQQPFDQRRVQSPLFGRPPSSQIPCSSPRNLQPPKPYPPCSQPQSFRRSFIPSDFRPRSHFLNGMPSPRFPPSQDQRWAERYSHGGEGVPDYRWDPLGSPFPWEMPGRGPHYNRPSPPGRREGHTPTGWKIKPLDDRAQRGSGGSDASCCHEQDFAEKSIVNKPESLCVEGSHRFDHQSDRSKDKSHSVKSHRLVDYGSSEESSGEEKFHEALESTEVYSTTENERTITRNASVDMFTPKKFRPNVGNSYKVQSYDNAQSTQVENIAEPAAARWVRPPLKLAQKVLKSFSTSDLSRCKPQGQDKPSETHCGKKRTLAEILATGSSENHEYSRSGVVENESKSNQCAFQRSNPKQLSPLNSQKQDLPPLPPLPPFPASPFWGMYMPGSSSALTGTEKQPEKSYSDPAKVDTWRNPNNQYNDRRYTRRSWPVSAGTNNYMQSSESDSDGRVGVVSDWKKNFKQFHSFGVRYIDTHCHLDFLFSRENFRGNLKDYMAKYPESFPDMFEGCVAVFCNPSSFNPHYGLWLEVAKEDNVWIAMGCHPKSATDFTAAAEQGLRKCLRHSKCVALGEIGLDYSGRFWEHEAEQKRVFRKQLEIAVEMSKPLVIHSRAAEDDCLAILKEMVPRDYKIHCHCFTAAFANAKLWLDAFPNLYIGLTPLVTYRTATPTHDTAMKIPLNRLLLETDAPYFIPKCIPKSDLLFSNPGLAITVAKEVAQFQELPVAAVLRQCRLNTKFMYGI